MTKELETRFESEMEALHKILEEKFKGFAKDTDDRSADMTETLEKRLESVIGELVTKLKSLDIDVQHHVRRRDKVESLECEVEKQENELATQQSATQKLLQDVEDLRQKLEKEDSRIQACRSVSDQTIGLFKTESRTRIDNLLSKVSRMESYFEQPAYPGSG